MLGDSKAKKVDAPEAVAGLPDNREPRRVIAAWRRSVVLNEDVPHDILVDLEAEGTRDLLGNFYVSPNVGCAVSSRPPRQSTRWRDLWARATGSIGAI